MVEEWKEHTTFVRRDGTLNFKVIPFGLINLRATVQKMIDRIHSNIPYADEYLDDVVIHYRTLVEHVEHLEMVFLCIFGHQLKLRVEKCSCFAKSIDLLGHVVTQSGVKTDPEKIDAARNARVLQDRRGVRNFLGLVEYYRRLIRGFSGISVSLHAATSKKETFSWTDDTRKRSIP